MKIKLLITFLLISTNLIFAQESYYNGIDFSQNGQTLYTALQNKISNYNTAFTYGDNRDTMKTTDDEDFNDADNNDTSTTVWLIYGYNDTDASCINDRTRNENLFGGSNCEYNREHVFARSLAVPEMGDTSNSNTGIVADPHNIRPSDVQFNNQRGSLKFATGSGNAGPSNGGWYPGDEWKGDVARMMMYMYTRYDDQCKPEYVGIGALQGTTEMLQLFLQWNVDDPVSAFEYQRNQYLETAYGNRNPFIDNPYLATKIWGGTAAEDKWGTLGIDEIAATNFSMFPNPSSTHSVTIQSGNYSISDVALYNVFGQKILQKKYTENNNQVTLDNLQSGFYVVRIHSESGIASKKLVVK